MKTVIEILNDIENKWNNRETGTDFLEGCRNGGIYALREAKERIKKETGWISVEDRIPSKDGKFFLCVHEKIPDYIISAYWGTYHPNAKGENCWRNSRREKILFTHWMHLPLPPNE